MGPSSRLALINEDAWLSEIFGHAVFRLQLSDYDTPERAATLIRNHVEEHRPAMYYVRVGTDQVDAVRAFGQVGMYVVDVNVTLRLASARSSALERPNYPVQVREAAPSEYKALLAIAGSCFRYSRFHLDPEVPADVAHRVKYEWIRSYTRGQRGDKLYAALLDGQPVGFLAVLCLDRAGRRVAVIDLVGVQVDKQGQGIGQALTSFFVERYGPANDALEIGTQVANVPALRLYEKFGFRVGNAQYVMHMHVPCGG